MSHDRVRIAPGAHESAANPSGAQNPVSPAGARTPDGAGSAPNQPVAPGEALLPLIDPVPHGRGWVFTTESSLPCPLPGGMATSVQIDAFRELRTRLILKARESGLSHFTTLVVPLTENAGGSFVARNLAATFTLQNSGSLLIECNFRNPSQNDALRAHVEFEGLFEFLARGDEDVRILVRQTVIPGLYLIPAGPCERTYAAQVDVLSSTSMKALLSKLRGYPCQIVLDSPPVLGSPEARILSELADFVVLVVRSGRSTIQEIAKAAKLFDLKKLAGVAFNEYAGGGREQHAQ